MAGISSKSLPQSTTNKYKANSGSELGSVEWVDGSGLELYETDYRSYDAQIGRFHQADPLMEVTADLTPYQFGNNNPVIFTDPSGAVATQQMSMDDIIGKLWNSVFGGSWSNDTGGSGGSFSFFDSNGPALSGIGYDDWVQTTSGQMLWDDRVINQAAATKYYGEGATYRAPGYKYTSSSGNVILGDNKQYTQDDNTKKAVNSTPCLGDRIGFEIINWFETTDFILEGSAKLTAGTQIGLGGNLWALKGKVEGGYEVYDIAEGKINLTHEPSNKLMPNNVHSFIGGEVKLFSEKISLGAGYDYTYKYYNSYYGPKMINGSQQHNWKVNVPFRNFGPKQFLSVMGGAEQSDGKTFYGLDIGATVKCIFGIEAKIKIGISR